MDIYLISDIEVSPMALERFDNTKTSPSAGPVHGHGAQLEHSRRAPSD